MKWASTMGLVLVSLVCSAGSAQERVGTSPTSATADVEAWIAANPALATIRTLEQFQAVPGQVARGVFQTLSAEVQHGLWKRKLAEAMDSGRLDERQLGIVAVADCLLTPELYSSERTSETEELLHNLEADARTVFTETEFRALFLTLGTEPGTEPVSVEELAPLVVQAADCECNTHSDYCGGSASGTSKCVRTGTCRVTQGGCGFLWAYLCNGMCKRIRK